jgi:hypothetical protein
MPGDSSKLGKIRKELRKMQQAGQKEIVTSQLGQATNLTTTSVGLHLRELVDEFDIVRTGVGKWEFL